MNQIGVYKISCVNGYIYYGRSNNIKLRIYNHLFDLKKGKHHCKRMQKDFNELGESAFQFITVAQMNTYKEACILEKKLVDKNIASTKSYNIQRVIIVDNPPSRGTDSMVRFSLSVSWPQYEALVKLSKKLGISLGELIRRSIDDLLGKK